MVNYMFKISKKIKWEEIWGYSQYIGINSKPYIAVVTVVIYNTIISELTQR